MKKRYIFIQFIFFVLFACSSVPDEDSQEKNDNDSNTAILSIDVPNAQENYLIYKHENKFWIEVIDFSNQENITVEKKDLKIDVIDSEYKFGYIGNKIILYCNNTLYLIDIPLSTHEKKIIADTQDEIIEEELLAEQDELVVPDIKVEEGDDSNVIVSESNEIEQDLSVADSSMSGNETSSCYFIQLDNVSEVLFYCDTCFYIDDEDSIFVFSKEENDFIKYDNIEINSNYKSMLVIETNDLASITRNERQRWYDGFMKKLIFETTNSNLTINDNIIFNRYVELGKIDKAKTQSAPDDDNESIIYNSFDEWYEVEIKARQNQVNEDKERLRTDFLNKWGIMPSVYGNLFSRDLNNYIKDKIDSGIEINTYQGKNEELQLLINFYNEIVFAYKKLSLRYTISQDTLNALETSYKNVSDEIVKAVKGEQEKYDLAVKEIFEEKYVGVEKAMLDALSDSSFSLALDISLYNSQSDYFDYIFLPAVDGIPAYTLIYKSIVQNEYRQKFQMIGQDVKVMHIHDGFLSTIENYEICFYDILTLKKKRLNNITSRRIANEQPLFWIDNQENIVVTLNNSSGEDIYNIRRVDIEDDSYKLGEIDLPYFSNNTNKDIRNKKEIFFTDIVSVNNKSIYVNIVKSKINESTSIRNGYIYRETPSGAGIIFQRRSDE